MPIAIRCPRHPWGDANFGQMGYLRNLAGKRFFRFINRLPRQDPIAHDPAMPTIDVFPPLMSAAALPVARRQQPGRPRRPGPPRS